MLVHVKMQMMNTIIVQLSHVSHGCRGAALVIAIPRTGRTHQVCLFTWTCLKKAQEFACLPEALFGLNCYHQTLLMSCFDYLLFLLLFLITLLAYCPSLVLFFDLSTCVFLCLPCWLH